MTKYSCRLNNRWGCEAKIEEIEVEKESEKSVWIEGNRNAKMSDYANYYSSWDEAKNALYSCQKTYVDGVRSSLERAKGVLGNIKGMKR